MQLRVMRCRAVRVITSCTSVHKPWSRGKPVRNPAREQLPSEHKRLGSASERINSGRAEQASSPGPSRTCCRIAAPYRAARRPAYSITVSVRTKSTRGQPGCRKIAPFEAQHPPQDPSPDRDLERRRARTVETRNEERPVDARTVETRNDGPLHRAPRDYSPRLGALRLALGQRPRRGRGRVQRARAPHGPPFVGQVVQHDPGPGPHDGGDDVGPPLHDAGRRRRLPLRGRGLCTAASAGVDGRRSSSDVRSVRRRHGRGRHGREGPAAVLGDGRSCKERRST